MQSGSLVPSSEVPNALAALRRMLPGASWLHGAVAFATQGGVTLLQDLVGEVGMPSQAVRIVVRGAPITDPQAVIGLDGLGADVRVVIGEAAPRFHPKLWVARTPSETWVLSGSGNLTVGGLRDNEEQFELLRFEQSTPSPNGGPVGSNREATEHLTRWRRFFDKGTPLGAARATPAWAAWESQLGRRAAIRAELDALDSELASARTSGPGIDGGGDGSGRALSATTERPTIEGWMRHWYPDEAVRMTVWELLADAIQAAQERRPNGWAACAVHWSNHDGKPRLEVLCGVSQVFVVHSVRGVFFESPPEHVDAAGHAAAMRAAEVEGATVEPWNVADQGSLSVVVPAEQAAIAAEVGGREAVEATIRWRSPKIETGKAGHAQYHCPAFVDAVGRATGRQLVQPGYATWR